MIRNRPLRVRLALQPRTTQGGFTLFEIVLVIAVLAIVSAGLIAILPQVSKAQSSAREQAIGLELLRSCAERLLADRRAGTIASVSVDLCSGLAQAADGFSNSPSVRLVSTVNGSDTSCSTAPCTCDANSTNCVATVTLAKNIGVMTQLQPLTIQFRPY